MNSLDQKITAQFPGLVVRKDLAKAIKGNAIVPTYVLEYLLGQYCATSDEDSIQSGIDTGSGNIAQALCEPQRSGPGSAPTSASAGATR